MPGAMATGLQAAAFKNVLAKGAWTSEAGGPPRSPARQGHRFPAGPSPSGEPGMSTKSSSLTGFASGSSVTTVMDFSWLPFWLPTEKAATTTPLSPGLYVFLETSAARHRQLVSIETRATVLPPSFRNGKSTFMTRWPGCAVILMHVRSHTNPSAGDVDTPRKHRSRANWTGFRVIASLLRSGDLVDLDERDARVAAGAGHLRRVGAGGQRDQDRRGAARVAAGAGHLRRVGAGGQRDQDRRVAAHRIVPCERADRGGRGRNLRVAGPAVVRSEKRRVGKECRSRWSAD